MQIIQGKARIEIQVYLDFWLRWWHEGILSLFSSIETLWEGQKDKLQRKIQQHYFQ